MQDQATNLQNIKHHVKNSDSSLTLVDSSVLPSQISLNPSTVTTVVRSKRSEQQNENSFENEDEKNDKINFLTTLNKNKILSSTSSTDFFLLKIKSMSSSPQ